MPRIAVITADDNPNFHALLEAHQEQNLKDGEVTLVASSGENPLRQAREAGIETLELPAGSACDGELAARLAPHKPDLIVALDDPHHFDAAFLRKFPRKVIAVHPALAGQFPAPDAIQQAYEAFQKQEIKWSGCNIHYVGPNGSTAEVMRQIVVPVEPKEPLDHFTARVRKSEKWLLLKGVKQFLYELRNRKPRHTAAQSQS